METTIHGKHLEVTDSLEKYAREKVAKLGDRSDDVLGVEIWIGAEAGHTKTAAALWKVRGKKAIRIEESDEDAYAAIDKLAGASKTALERDKGRRGAKSHT